MFCTQSITFFLLLYTSVSINLIYLKELEVNLVDRSVQILQTRIVGKFYNYFVRFTVLISLLLIQYLGFHTTEVVIYQFKFNASKK